MNLIDWNTKFLPQRAKIENFIIEPIYTIHMVKMVSFSKGWLYSYAKINKKPSILKQLFLTCITFKTEVANLQSN